MLEKEKPVYQLFQELTIVTPQDNMIERSRKLELLLKSKINMYDDSELESDDSSEQSTTEMSKLFLLTIQNVDEWQKVLKTASSLLVDLSTFPTNFSGDRLSVDEDPTVQVLPEWLKVLVVCSCWLTKQPSLQLISISTLLDLIALFKSNSDIKPRSEGEGVIAIVMIPLLKRWHIAFLQHRTNVFQILSHCLWRHLGELPPHKYRIW